MPAEALGPHLFPVTHDPGGRVLLRIDLKVVGVTRAHGEVLRAGFVIAPMKKGRPLEAVAVGPRQKTGPSLLRGEVWLFPGSYRIFPVRNPRQTLRFDIRPEPGAALRAYCAHPARVPTQIDTLGAFSPAGIQMALIRRYRIQPCCAGWHRSARPPGESFNTRALGFVEAFSRPLGIESGGRTIFLSSGEGFVVNRNEILAFSDDTFLPSHFRQVVVESQELDRFLDRARPFLPRGKLVFDPVPAPVPPAVSAAIVGLEDAMSRPQGIGGALHLETSLQGYLFSLLRGFPNPGAAALEKTPSERISDTRLAQAVSYLKRHYARPYDRTALAEYACVSHQRLQQLFHEHLKTDARAYLLGIRMEHARKLLAAGKKTYIEVGRLVGYNDPRTFRRKYRAYMQIPAGKPN